jgi:hypothetical protein
MYKLNIVTALKIKMVFEFATLGRALSHGSLYSQAHYRGVTCPSGRIVSV